VDELRRRADILEQMLEDLAAMVDCHDRSQLVGTMRAALERSAKVRELEGEVSSLQAECEGFRNVIWSQEELIRNVSTTTQASV
jgi:uncharacterized coiled-coil DUF342 family protein